MSYILLHPLHQHGFVLLLAASLSLIGCSSGGDDGGGTVVNRPAADFPEASKAEAGATYRSIAILAGTPLGLEDNQKQGFARRVGRQSESETILLDLDEDGTDDIRIQSSGEQTLHSPTTGGSASGRAVVTFLTDYHDDDLSGRTWIFPAGTVLSLGVESEVANYSEATQRLEVSFVFDFSDVELQWTNGSQSGVVKYQDASFAITDVATATQLLSETEGDIQVRVDDRDYRFLWTEVHSETQASEDAQFSQSLGVDIEGASFEFGPYSITDIDAAPTIYIQIDKVRYGPFTADEVESWLNDDEAAG